MTRRPKLEWRNRFLLGDVREQLRLLPKNSVQCVVTSPPYYALRDYGAAGQIGLEDTIDAFIATLVDVFEEVRRVLRPDGVLWVNMGDAFVGGRRGGVGKASTQQAHRFSLRRDRDDAGDTRHKTAPGLKPKDLMGQPWRLAFALQAAGWYLRMDNIWHKPNPTPESTRDRTTRAHEYLFMFTKRARYFYDAEAIREPVQASSLARIRQRTFAQHTGGPKDYRNTTEGGARSRSTRQVTEHEADRMNASLAAGLVPTANKRSVWTIPPAPSKLKHYATFPPDLVEPCIKASTSEAGCCAKCGRPWRRVVEKVDRAGILGKGWHDHQDDMGRGQRGTPPADNAPLRVTRGWAPTCVNHRDAGVAPCVVLDPFMGTGTTAAVAWALDRDWVGIDISAEYVAIAQKRLHEIEVQGRIKLQPVLLDMDEAHQLQMFTEVAG